MNRGDKLEIRIRDASYNVLYKSEATIDDKKQLMVLNSDMDKYGLEIRKKIRGNFKDLDWFEDS